MSDALPRLCWNDAGAVSSNTLHNVRLPGVPRALAPALVAAFYNSATLLSCERVGRSYGGGVLKLEPREADRVLLPALALVARHQSALERLAPSIDAALRAGHEAGIQEAISEVDRLLYSEAERRDFADLRAQLLARRRARRPSRTRVVLPL
jgi:adenine-specific DNA-methyltransferase